MCAIKIAYNGASLTKPGAYSKMDVELNGGMALSPAGIVGIVGEAYGGAPGSTDGVQQFDSTQLFDIVTKYVRGPIVDAARALLDPSKDSDIVNGANEIKIYKTNSSTQGTSYTRNQDDAPGPTTIFNLESFNYGADENNTNFYITEGTIVDEHSEFISGSITFPVAPTPGGVLVYRFMTSNYTFTMPAGGPYTQAQLVTVLNTDLNWAPSRPCIATAYGADQIKIGLNTSLAAFDGFETMHEYGVAFLGGLISDEELKFRTRTNFATDGTAGGTFTVASTTGLAVNMWTQVSDNDSGSVYVKISSITGSGPYTITCTDLLGAVINLAAYTVGQSARIWGSSSIVEPTTLVVTDGNGGYGRGNRGSRIFITKKNDTNETIAENSNVSVFRIWYKGAGSNATMTIQEVAGILTLTTSCTGAAGDNLNVVIANYTTVSQLVDYIDNFGGGSKYQCYTDYFNAASFNPINLDQYSAVNISLFPLEVKAAHYEMITNINTYSQLIVAEIVDNVYGQIETIASTAKRFLTGATNGGSSNTYFQNGFDALLNEECNIVVPLVCRDASSDIAEALTDASSTYTISSVAAMTDTHCRTASNTINRSERTAFVGLKATYAATKTAAQLANSEYTSLVLQDCQVLDASSTMTWKNPNIFAALCAGLEAGAEIGLPLTKKALNCNGVRHSTFNPKTQYADAIEAGLFIAEMPNKGGVVIVCGNTTYQKDASFVFNRRSVLRAAHYTAKTLREQLETAFVGKTKAMGTTLAQGVRSYAQTILGSLLRDNILAGDAKNKGLGYRNLTVWINASVVTLSVIITPVQGIDFVLNNITLSAINDVA